MEVVTAIPERSGSEISNRKPWGLNPIKEETAQCMLFWADVGMGSDNSKKAL